MKTDELVKGLISGWLLDQIDSKSKFPSWLAIGLGAFGFIVVVLAGGWVRGLGVVIVLLGLIGFLLILLARTAAKRVIRRFAEPQSIVEKRADIDAALSEADLPDGPLAIMRFLWRLRRGVGSEVKRLAGIVSDLQADVGVGPAINQLVDDPTPELPEP